MRSRRIENDLYYIWFADARATSARLLWSSDVRNAESENNAVLLDVQVI